jgi:hypothetical protein
LGSLFLAIALIVCARWFFRSELSDAVADSLRRRHADGIDPVLVERVEEIAERMEEEIGQLRADVGELGERVEFTERLLAAVRDREGLQGANST